MVGLRSLVLGMAAGMAFAAAPAQAQFFLKSKDISGAPVIGDEPGIVQPMPGATPAEVSAGLVWNMRAALNVAALQCQFEPTMVTVSNYNAVLTDHKDELKKSFDTLTKYFMRVKKAPRAGQMALDQFGTRTYAAFSTVAAQLNFCETANSIGRDAVFAPRGKFVDVAKARSRELANSLVPWEDQTRVRYVFARTSLPPVNPACWSKKGDWQAKKCGALVWPPLGVATAQR